MLAYNHESEDIKQRTTLMKKMDKRVKRILKNDRGLSQTMKDLYENPIASLKKAAQKMSM
jgi:hypothetical protein